jgi:ATPase subunit of ABC transporter with duplicated ATPase domains
MAPILTAQAISKRFGATPLFENLSLSVNDGDRIGLIGPNGAGKSTLLALLAGDQQPDSGEVAIRRRATVTYVQQVSHFQPQVTVREIIERAMDRVAVPAEEREQRLRETLGRAGFTDDGSAGPSFRDAATSLSGGWRKRLALVEGMVQRPDVLLLDEPTNHLDIRAKDVLLESLSKFQGTVVFVSHDRYFIDKLATRVFEIGSGRVEIYPGNYEDFLWRKQGGAAKLQESVATATHMVPSANGNGNAPAAFESKAKRINPIKRKHMEQRAQRLEEDIAGLETTIAACESSLQNFVSAEETARLAQQLDQSRTELQERTAEWEQIGQELEAATDKA